MATVTGQTGVVKLQLAGVNEAVVGEVTSFTLETSADTIEDSSMGNTSRTYKAGLDSSTVSLDCYWDQTDAQQLVLDSRATVDFEISPSGTASGSKKYSGSGIVTSKSINASFDGMVEASFSIQVSGAVTEAAH